MFALQDARPDDLVLILDVDEIPDPEVLRRLKRDGLERPMRLGMTRHYEHPLRLGPRSPCCANSALPFATALPRLKPGRWEALDPMWFCAPGVVVRVMDILGDPARGLPPRSMQARAGGCMPHRSFRAPAGISRMSIRRHVRPGNSAGSPMPIWRQTAPPIRDIWNGAAAMACITRAGGMPRCRKGRYRRISAGW